MTTKMDDCMLRSVDELIEGESYFAISFWDTTSFIPSIQTWIYVGKNLLSSQTSNKPLYYFQDPGSFLAHGSFIFQNTQVERDMLEADEDTVSGLFSFKGLQTALSTFAPKVLPLIRYK